MEAMIARGSDLDASESAVVTLGVRLERHSTNPGAVDVLSFTLIESKSIGQLTVIM